jgi:hypothetical protein
LAVIFLDEMEALCPASSSSSQSGVRGREGGREGRKDVSTDDGQSCSYYIVSSSFPPSLPPSLTHSLPQVSRIATQLGACLDSSLFVCLS